MHGLTKMIKVEIVVPGKDAAPIRSLITASGATGYTAVSGVSGLGHHGPHSGALLFNDYDTLTMLITVLPPERADDLIGAARELLTTRSGVMFVTETFVSRPEYFQ